MAKNLLKRNADDLETEMCEIIRNYPAGSSYREECASAFLAQYSLHQGDAAATKQEREKIARCVCMLCPSEKFKKYHAPWLEELRNFSLEEGEQIVQEIEEILSFDLSQQRKNEEKQFFYVHYLGQNKMDRFLDGESAEPVAEVFADNQAAEFVQGDTAAKAPETKKKQRKPAL